MTISLYHCWFRHGGSNRRFFRIAERRNLNDAQKLFCALVRMDAAEAATLMSSDCARWLLPFLGVIQDNALAGFVCDRIFELGLGDLAGSARATPETDSDRVFDGVWFENTLLTNLQRMSALESAHHERFEKRLEKLLLALSPILPHLVWPKGISLSRLLYAEPSHRASGDFDFIVAPDLAGDVVTLCSRERYTPISGDAGFCNQLQVGPTRSLAQLFLAPVQDFVPSAVYGLGKDDGPLIDPKFNPLDRGIKFAEIDRFYRDAIDVRLGQTVFKAPSHIDHLLICLLHLEKDRFSGWKSLLDVHLLAAAVDHLNGWNEFERRCLLEGIALSAWAGLSLVKDRFDSPVPADMIERLRPAHISTLFSFTVEPLFYWNCASMAVLLLNALYTGDCKRKLRTLRQSFLPAGEFLRHYYIVGGSETPLPFALALVLHWLVLLLPGIAVRTTFGKRLWPDGDQYKELLRQTEPERAGG